MLYLFNSNALALRSFTTLNSKQTLFVGNFGDYGEELCVTDGTKEGTHIINIVPDKPGYTDNGSSPDGLFRFKDKVYFNAVIKGHNMLYVTDGTDTGTYSIYPDLQTSRYVTNRFGVYKDKLYFGGTLDHLDQYDLWVTDGTNGGTKKIKDIHKYHDGIYGPNDFFVLKDKLYFTVTDERRNSFLWVSDGTESGTHELMSISQQPFVYHDKMFFQSYDGMYTHLSVTDGTVEGTHILKNNLSVRSLSIVYKDKLYFTAQIPGVDPYLYYYLWVTDGTAEGTHIVKKIAPSSFTIFKDKLFIIADQDQSYNMKIWSTDGTESGTQIAEGFSKGPAKADPQELTVYNGRLYFIAYTPDKSRELWVTDGRPNAATVVVPKPIHPKEIKKDNPLEYCLQLYPSNGSLYYGAEYIAWVPIEGGVLIPPGEQPYILTTLPPERSESDRPDFPAMNNPIRVQDTTELLTAIPIHFPNPAQDQITISCESKISDIKIRDTKGTIIYYKTGINTNNIKVNTSTFENGLYFVVVTTVKGTFSSKLQILH